MTQRRALATRHQALNRFAKNLKDMLLWLSLSTIIVVGGLVLGIRQRIMRPLGELKDAVEAFSEGRNASRVTVRTADEFGVVAASFNLMAESIERSTADLTEANRQLLDANKHKDEFLAVIGHELRTPLNGIKGDSELLQDELEGPLNERQHLSVRRIAMNNDRLCHLVGNLLDLARILAGRLEIVARPTAYASLIDAVAEKFRPLATEKAIQLSSHVDGSVVDIDEARIVQVLGNLVDNAVNFTPEGGRIDISVEDDQDHFTTRVADTGAGIAAADIPFLFDKFKQADMSSTRSRGGAGLGLAICKELVEAHGGSIGVDSQPGVGSSFWFTLPAIAGEPEGQDIDKSIGSPS